MSGQNEFEVNVTEECIEVLVDDQTSAQASQIARAGVEDLALGATDVQIDFPTNLADVNYQIVPTLLNTVDSFPQFITLVNSLKEVGRAKFKLSAPTDTVNYKVSWILSPNNNP